MTAAILSIGVSAFSTSKYSCLRDSRFPESRRAFDHASPPGLTPGRCDHHPEANILPLVGVSGFVMPKCIHLRDSRSLKSRSSVALTAGLHYAFVFLLCCDDSWPPLIGVSRIAISKCTGFLPSKPPMLRSPTLLDLLTRVCQMNGLDLVRKSRIVILSCMNPLLPGSPIS
jgi:hypothetical protein